MTEKLKVSREVADAIECVKRECYGFNATMNIHIKNGWTPHEVIAAEYIASQQDWVNNGHLHSKGFAEGIEFTLDTLNITVEGVNDHDR